METSTLEQRMPQNAGTSTSYGGTKPLTREQVYASIVSRIKNLGTNVREKAKKSDGRISPNELLSHEGEVLQWLIDSYHSRRGVSFFQKNYLSRELLQKTREISGAIDLESKHADRMYRRKLANLSLN